MGNNHLQNIFAWAVKETTGTMALNAVYLCNFSDTSGNKPKNMSEFTSDKLEGFLLSIEQIFIGTF